MNNSAKSSRITVILLFITAMLVIFVIALYKLQVVDASEYSYDEQRLTVSTKTVAASRGDILDRYGRVLVSDRECSNVMIDRLTLINSPDPNGTVYELVSTVLALNVPYTDTLPVTAQRYVSDMSDTQRSRLEEYIKFFDLDPDISAPELFAFFRSHYKIAPELSDYDARLIIGVRYELEIRVIVNAPEYVFASDVGIDLISILAEHNFPGVSVVSSSVREYHTKYAAHILGYIGKMDQTEMEKYTALGYPMDALVGKSGVELAFEDYLHGTDGTVKVTTSSAGIVTNEETVTEVQPGNNVSLTIDIGLQEAAENALASRIAEINDSRRPGLEKAEVGALVAVDVNSCEVLACASYPGYDPATFMQNYSMLSTSETHPLVNRATRGTYSPGSTFKMTTAIAALEEGIIGVYTPIEDKGRYTKYAADLYTPKCWIYPDNHGSISVSKAIEVSCNYFFYTVGDNLGIDLLSAYARAFGLGQKTGIEIGEEEGILACRDYKNSVVGEPWYPGDTLQAAIGQSYNQFTPIQLAVYTAAIANGGTRYAATLLRSVKSGDYSEPIYVQQARVLSTVEAEPEYFDAARRGMLAVSENGTAKPVFGDYFVDVASKTGTAQLGENRTNNAVFICYAPYDEPEIAIAVVVEKGGSGSAVASIARDVLDYYFTSRAELDMPENENTLIK